MTPNGTAGSRMRALLDGGGPVLVPACGDAIFARLIEASGFPATYISGGWSAGTLGFPDVGLMTFTEMLANSRSIASAVSIPVITDADTGFGELVNVRRTVREFEAAGLAGVQLEDQALPKKCGLYDGKRVVPPSEMAQKVRVAVESKTDDSFIIVARTDALGSEGLEATLNRGRLYFEAGADMFFVESIRTEEQMKAVGDAFGDRYLLLNRTPAGHSPIVDADVAYGWGFNLIVLPMQVILAGMYAARALLAEIAQTGRCDSFEEKMLSIHEFFVLSGLEEAEALEQSFARDGEPQFKDAASPSVV